MNPEKTTEQQTGEVRFSHINRISYDDWQKIRQYILVSSRGYDSDTIKAQLEIDSSPEYQYQPLPVSEGMAINPNYLIINFEFSNIPLIGISIPLSDFLEVIFETDAEITKINKSVNDGLRTELKEMFDNDPILKSLLDELQQSGILLEQREFQALSRAIMTQRALLILINYPDLV